MATVIHPTAIIESGAEVDNDVSVGSYAYVGSRVRLGKGTRIHHHASIEGNTTLGVENEVFPYAFIGGKTHDLKYKGGNPSLKIGNYNVFREYVTVHVATYENDFTLIGDYNVILAYSHVAHDCKVGNHLIMSSHSALGGHVIVEHYVNIGAYVGVHQFCRLGTHCMLGFKSKIVQDIPPYMLVDGNPAVVRTFNKIGLERLGFESSEIETARKIYQILYRDGLNRSQALERLKMDSSNSSTLLIQNVITFAEKSERGLI